MPDISGNEYTNNYFTLLGQDLSKYKQWRRQNKFESGGGGTGPKQKWGGRAPPLFGSKSTISCFGERFRDGQYSLVSFLFAVLLLTVPPELSHL